MFGPGGNIRIIGHRGARGVAPENTVPAIRHGVEVGSQAIEIDLHASKDEELIVIHDPTLERTTDGTGPVEQREFVQWRAAMVRRYRVDLPAFEATALPAIDPHRVSAPLVVIDEIGKMECFSTRFREVVVAALRSDRVVLATVALRGDRFIEDLKARPDVYLIHVSQQNRDQLVGQTVDRVQEVLAGA